MLNAELNMIEQGVVFYSRNKQLVAIEHQALEKSSQGLVLVVGGPQTRVGSHRLFVHLARALAKQGVHVFRFDYTGAGDSEGEVTQFTDIQADIDAALSCFAKRNPDINAFSLLGLCDAASAILLYLKQKQDARIERVFLLNPWVRQELTQAKMFLGSYYLKRLTSLDFWKKFFTGKVNVTQSGKEIKQYSNIVRSSSATSTSFVDDMLQGLVTFNGDSHIILSGNDLTADEFRVLCQSNHHWQDAVASRLVQQHTVKLADHTFSQADEEQKLLSLITNIFA
ncbi:hydrolase 1, exosortase A system-associated [Litorilituus sediminis]|uniref:Hydrolase 1, exosortase A system-associated n=2 Tax=Litorilituus sediminis TaxID=718192 RepID=A0A4P6P685_9GAMM|nr:hydrolase 1, exosortase A system-associated [Litorilituus sediminis]